MEQFITGMPGIRQRTELDGLGMDYSVVIHPNGELASEGTYKDGLEHGLWTDFHPNGQIAVKGHYEDGKEVGVWEFWDADGSPGSK